MFTGSVVSYEGRGNYGKSSWRGNCSGRIIRDLLETYRPAVFADPMEGSGTSADVVAEMNREGYRIEYCGLDIHRGFDILTDSLAARLQRPADLVFCHPPYHDMISYSSHPNDLSRCASYDEFLTKMQRALLNVYEALRSNGRYSVLIGDLRRAGTYYAMQAHLVAIAPGKLENIIIKRQHNCVSGRRAYSGNFVRIEHEYLVTFRRDQIVFGMFDATLQTSERLRMFSSCTWRAVIEYAFEQLGGRASLEELYQFIEERASDRIKSDHWKEKIRQTVRAFAVRLERGVWASPAATQAAA